jgi:F-type H+-transporting ATPase subunit b
MLIDWFTVVAQAVNFLVLVWLLKRFLYKPILDAIDAREKKIAETIAEAAETKQAAEMQRDEFERKNQQFGDNRDRLVLEMKEEINVKREQLLDDAHQSAEAISAKRIESLQRAQKTLADEIARQTQDQVFAISRKTLRDLADTSLEERITEAFTRQLRGMNGSTKRDFADSMTRTSEPVRVRSAFELTEEQQNSIRHAIKEISAGETPVDFELGPNAIAGIELTSSGRKIAWSIDEYLTSLQKSISELANPDAKALEVNTELESEPVS